MSCMSGFPRKRGHKIYPQNILECIGSIEKYTGGMSYEDLYDQEYTIKK
jgi:hypothetical protein